MKEQLAERLLARVMNWDAERVAKERPVLQSLAAYKYDEYQKFSPGQRFIESLALWLYDFKTTEYQEAAYTFVRTRLVFFSAAEIQHLVSIAYPDHIRPLLLQRAAKELNLDPYHVGKVITSTSFQLHQRSTLFLGLSDGARTDIFRRSNEEDLSHEQILQNYEIKAERVNKLLDKLRQDLRKKNTTIKDMDSETFNTIVLMDDFSASGTSYLRFKDEKSNDLKDENLEGKLFEFSRDVKDPKSPLARLVNSNTRIYLVIYIATNQAVDYLRNLLSKYWGAKDIQFDILVIHPLFPSIKIGPSDSLASLLEYFYDKETLEDEHINKGKQGVKYGYAACGLPVVLTHNTPNNSIYPIWARTSKLRALFPRISRHKRS
jgi:hypothetical protein